MLIAGPPLVHPSRSIHVSGGVYGSTSSPAAITNFSFHPVKWIPVEKMSTHAFCAGPRRGDASGSRDLAVRIIPGSDDERTVSPPRYVASSTMLRVVHGNRFEALADAIIAAVPAADPFAPTTIVASRGLVGTWLSYRLADARGIACGLDLPFLEKFVTSAYVDADGARAGLAALHRGQLAAAVGSVLADPDRLADPALARVRDYLGDPDRPDAAVRRVQLAHRVARLYWQYAMSRPEWLIAWDSGGAFELPERASADDARWQARLWSLVRDHVARGALPGAALIPRLPLARRRCGLAAPRLPRPVHVVGFSYLAPAYLDALADLGAHQDVTIYLVDPCADFWEDVRGGRAATAAERLLGLWGKPIRDSHAALVERTGGDFDGRFVEPARDTALAALLADVVARAPAPASPVPAPGVTVLACPSVRRELEVVGSEIVRLLAADPTLRATDVAVLVAGEPDAYLAQLPAVWSSLGGEPSAPDQPAPGLPFHVVDSQLASLTAQGGRVGEAALALLALPLGRFTRRELLGFMTHPCVLARHRHVDPADWVQWAERLGVVHGADADDHHGTYLEGTDQFHWDQGILRLALGGFMCGDRPGQPATPVDLTGRKLLPEEVSDDRQASAATFALLARSLIADARWLREQALPLARWAEVLDALLATYVTAADEPAARELGRIRNQVSDLAGLDLDGRPVEYREVVELVRHGLGALVGDRGEPLAHGVMVAPLAPMRPLPFRAVFVLGLAEGAFPASDPPSPIDLRDPPRAGEVSARDRDRVAFLDAVLAARDHLVLSYVALEPASGEPIAPSPVVLELADALAPYVGADSGAAALARITVRHPLHRWDAAYDAPALTPSPAPARLRERRSALLRAAIGDHLRARGYAYPSPDRLRELFVRAPALAPLARELLLDPATAGAQPDDDAPIRLSLATVRKFLEAPIQAWASAVLRIGELPDEELIDKSDEPFDFDPAGRAAVLRDTLAAVLGAGGAPVPVAEAHAAAIAARARRGGAPVGVFGAVAEEKDRALVETWRAAIEPFAGGARRVAFGRSLAGDAQIQPAIALAVDLGGRPRRIEVVGDTELLLSGEVATSLVIAPAKKVTRRHTLRGAIDHVALAAAAAPGGGAIAHRTIALDGTGGMHVVDHAAWTPDDARAFLAALVGELLARPHGYIIDLDECARVLQGKDAEIRPDRNDQPGSLGYGPVKRADRLALPPDPAGLARRRLAPLVERMSGDHKFGKGGDA
jgi:exodeoxyribonuclease V gamma subunit